MSATGTVPPSPGWQLDCPLLPHCSSVPRSQHGAYCVEKLFLRPQKTPYEKHDLIERSTIDERISVDGLMTPKILFGRVLKEFFNTICPFRPLRLTSAAPETSR